jgi:threonine dehydrogenase-like Zn-dependent dehydrogenase
MRQVVMHGPGADVLVAHHLVVDRFGAAVGPQVASADARRRQLDDGVGRLDDLRVLAVLDPDVVADGALVATPGTPEPDLIPSLMAASDVLGTGWFAVAAQAGPGKTVAVVGDGAVGLLGILAAKQLGAERIIAFSRHTDCQALAREFGATDIIRERGEAGVAKVKELAGGLGANSVIEAVGTQEAMMQAIHSTRPGGHVGFVGVSHDAAIPGDELFMAGVHIHGGPAPVRQYLPELIQLIWDRTINPGKVFDLTLPLDKTAEGYRAMDQRTATKVLLTL